MKANYNRRIPKPSAASSASTPVDPRSSYPYEGFPAIDAVRLAEMYHDAPRDMSASRFNPSRRTALLLTGEGTALAYLAGVLRAVQSAGIRIDLVVGRGAGAVAAAFASVQGEEHLEGRGGLIDTLQARRPYRLATSYRMALLCMAAAIAFFLSPGLLGIVSLVALPISVLLGPLIPGAETLSWLPSAFELAERFYLPSIALPMMVLFVFLTVKWLALALEHRSFGVAPFGSFFDLSPFSDGLEALMWLVVRGASSEKRPKNRKELGRAYSDLLKASLGQHGYRELVFYAFDSDAGREVPFVLVKDRFFETASSRRETATTSEPIDLSTEEGAGVLCEALVAASSPPLLVASVPIKLPLSHRHGGEVHRFCSSVLFGQGAVADAVAFGAEQVIYAIGSHPSDSLSGSTWERHSAAALRRSLGDDLTWAASSNVPVFVIRPHSERLRPFELAGRPQPGSERLGLDALVAQGQRDAERLFIDAVVVAEHGVSARPAKTAISTAAETRSSGPNEL
ncbi:MAG TPA: hypothetical protein VEK15_27155 [Vicinamibacteria bacterium]|nr:hypothetical protein [Vicinamibacteria bacterium]